MASPEYIATNLIKLIRDFYSDPANVAAYETWKASRPADNEKKG